MVVNVKCPKDLGPVDIARQKPVLPKRSEGMSLAETTDEFAWRPSHPASLLLVYKYKMDWLG
jgi:hypothetical protein